MAISASQVKELRERTGAGMMECKKALVEAEGNLDYAIEIMRKSGVAKADKKAGRIAAEGVVKLNISENLKSAILLEINTETDFTARDEKFSAFADAVADIALQNSHSDLDALLKDEINGKTIEDTRKELVAVIGENITLRRVKHVTTTDGVLGAYNHGGRIGVVVELNTDDAELAKDVAMHIAASNPQVINPKDFPEDQLEKEKNIYRAKSEASGKPAEIVEKIIQGQVNKFLNQVSLVGQQFVKDPDVTVGKLLESAKAKACTFVRFEVGEGIEKEKADFRKEVMEQARGSA